MMSLRPSRWVVVVGVALLCVVYAFLYGPLFAWSPVKPGYEAIHLARADVYFGAGTALNPTLRLVDQDIAHAERFHELTLRHRMTIVVCRSWADFHHFMPTVRGEGMGAVTPEYGTVIFVTPKIQQMGFDNGEFVRHELSHALLDQNATLWNSLHFKHAPWLVEGLAVLAAQQRAYGTWADFVKRIRTDSVLPLFSSDASTAAGFNMRFAYLAWRYFLAWRIDTRSRSSFQQFLTGFLRRPTEAEQVFQEVYREDLGNAVSHFEAAVRADVWRGE